MKKRSLIFFIAFLASIFTCISCVVLLNVVIDPYFHYHAPYHNKYGLYNPRYQNDGILKHFEYDALIIGTSMCENFKPTEFNQVFGVNSIKTCFSGAGYKEINDNLKTAIDHNPELKTVIRCLDYNLLLAPANHSRYDTYPTYLYDDNIFNDYKYYLDKDITQQSQAILAQIIRGDEVNNSFDDYTYWDTYYTFGKEQVLKNHYRAELQTDNGSLTPEERASVIKTITENVISTANQNKSITHYIFFSPYSIVFWDDTYRSGQLTKTIEAEKLAIELMLNCENIKLFSFHQNTDMICDLNNYKDPGHYSAEVNSKILNWMKNGEFQLTKNNYLQYISDCHNFYSSYDYDSIYTIDEEQPNN